MAYGATRERTDAWRRTANPRVGFSGSSHRLPQAGVSWRSFDFVFSWQPRCVTTYSQSSSRFITYPEAAVFAHCRRAFFDAAGFAFFFFFAADQTQFDLKVKVMSYSVQEDWLSGISYIDYTYPEKYAGSLRHLPY
eukprot:954927-Rhodomonas_salina.7